jgi:hypothetical protein
MVPLLQGMIWTLVLHGWRHWNRTAELRGNTVGARIRRWWYKTNNWPLANSLGSIGKDRKIARDLGEVSFRRRFLLLFAYLRSVVL